jgi:hypothetical protein
MTTSANANIGHELEEKNFTDNNINCNDYFDFFSFFCIV